MAGSGPRVALTPLELLENDTTREMPLLNKIFIPVFMGGVGFLGCLGANAIMRRPIFSGIQRQIVITLGMAGIGKLADDWKKQYLAERDAVYRHYVQLHPEDFPPYEQVLIRDVFEDWIPIR